MWKSEDACQDKQSSQSLEGSGDFSKQDSGKEGGHSRFTELGRRYKGRGHVFQAEAEHRMAKQGGADRQGKTAENSPASVSA